MLPKEVIRQNTSVCLCCQIFCSRRQVGPPAAFSVQALLRTEKTWVMSTREDKLMWDIWNEDATHSFVSNNQLLLPFLCRQGRNVGLLKVAITHNSWSRYELCFFNEGERDFYCSDLESFLSFSQLDPVWGSILIHFCGVLWHIPPFLHLFSLAGE